MATNPFLGQQAQAITNQVQQGFLQNVLPQINTGSIASGGFGGSRQGIAQGIAAGNAATGLSSSLANLYGNAYAQDQQIAAQQQMQAAQLSAQQRLAEMSDATQRFGLQNQFTLGQGNLGLGQFQAQTQRDLGFGNLGLGQLQANQNFYTSQRGQDLQSLGLGANLYGQGTQGLLGQGQGLYNIGTTQQQAPWQALQNYAQLLQPFSGLNQTQTQTQPGGSTLGGALGGALTAAQLWKLLGG